MFRSISRFLTRQFLFGRLWLWIKPKLHGLLTLALVIFLIFYIHSEYLSYVEFSEKFASRCLSLPIDPYLNKKEIKKIIKVLNSF